MTKENVCDMIMKRINEAFTPQEHACLIEKKSFLAGSLGLKRLSWKQFFLHVSGVRVLRSSNDSGDRK